MHTVELGDSHAAQALEELEVEASSLPARGRRQRRGHRLAELALVARADVAEIRIRRRRKGVAEAACPRSSLAPQRIAVKALDEAFQLVRMSLRPLGSPKSRSTNRAG